jgi:hypothetical protein
LLVRSLSSLYPSFLKISKSSFGFKGC